MNVAIKTKHLTIKIKDLFLRYKVKSELNAFCKLNNLIKVLSPSGYKNINYLFRTLKQQKIKIVLLNGYYIKCGLDHKLYMRPHNILIGQINSTYKKAKDILIGDYVAIKNLNEVVYLRQCFGDCLYEFIKVKAIIRIDNDELILYDMLVDLTHEYFANGILSHNSWFLAGIGAEALKQDKKVLHYTLLLTDDYTYMRYDSILSGIPFQKLLLAKLRVKLSLLRFQKYEGNLRVKYYPTKTATAGMLLNHIKQCELLLKFKPDIIIIDYADLLKPLHQYDNSYHTIGDIYLALRGMAGILEVPIWSASQINRCLSTTLRVIIQLRTKLNLDSKTGFWWYDNVLIGTVKQGLHIFTNRGESGFSKITKVYPILKQVVYLIRLVHGYGPTIKCSKNHMFPVASLNDQIKSILTGLSVGDRLWRMTSTDMWKDVIHSITLIGWELTIDIEVEDGHLFFCNNILTHNSGSDKLIIDKLDLALSYKKILIADFAFSISRKLSDKISLTARINIMKNRFGPDGLVYNADMDANIGKITIYDSHTLNSVKTKLKMLNGTKVIASKISLRLTQLQIKKLNGDLNVG